MKIVIKVKQIENVCLMLVDKKRETVKAMNESLLELSKLDKVSNGEYTSIAIQIGSIFTNESKLSSITFSNTEQCSSFIETLSCVKKISVKAFKLRDLQKKGE